LKASAAVTSLEGLNLDNAVFFHLNVVTPETGSVRCPHPPKHRLLQKAGLRPHQWATPRLRIVLGVLTIVDNYLVRASATAAAGPGYLLEKTFLPYKAKVCGVALATNPWDYFCPD
jgi:hypothetical protein